MAADGSGGFLLQRNWRNSSANSTAPPCSLRSPSRRKMFSAFLILCAPDFSFKKEKNIFLRDSALRSQAGGGSAIRTSAKRKNYFLGRDFPLCLRLFVFRIGKKKKGSGENEFLPILFFLGAGLTHEYIHDTG